MSKWEKILNIRLPKMKIRLVYLTISVALFANVNVLADSKNILKTKSYLESDCGSKNTPVCNSCVRNTVIPLVESEYHSYIQHLENKNIPGILNSLRLNDRTDYSELISRLRIKINDKTNNFKEGLISDLQQIRVCINENKTDCKSCDAINDRRQDWNNTRNEIDDCLSVIKGKLNGAESQLVCSLIDITHPLLSAKPEQPKPEQPKQEQPKPEQPKPDHKACVTGKKGILPEIFKPLLTHSYIYIAPNDYTDELHNLGNDSNGFYLRKFAEKMGIKQLKIEKGFFIQTDESPVTDLMAYLSTEGKYIDLLDDTYCSNKKSLVDPMLPARCIPIENVNNYIHWLNSKDEELSFSLPTIEQWLVVSILYKEDSPVLDQKEPMETGLESQKIKNLLGNTSEISATKIMDEHYLLGKSFRDTELFRLVEVKIGSVPTTESREHYGFRLVITQKETSECAP